MAASQPNNQAAPQRLNGFGAPEGAVDLNELYHSIIHNRTAFTTIRSQHREHPRNDELGYDFLTLIALICDIYQAYSGDLIVMQSFHPTSESFENRGGSCVVSRKAIATPTPSNIARGQTNNLEESIIVKRTRQGILEPQSSALRSFITELRVRAHLPLRLHPNIVDLKGVAWDFEDDGRKIPRPLLLEELAVERSLSHFWATRNLTRMPFKVKVDLCLDIANGLLALHSCDIAHGDVKPDNILVFPRPGSQDAYMAKLTDFGHSVFAYEGRTALPAFTLQYSAPEANEDRALTFQDMKQTDVYSYGLVVLAVVIGRSYSDDFGDSLESSKKDDGLLKQAMALVETEDRDNTDSDFDLVTLRSIFTHSIQYDSGKRDLAKCIRVIKRYNNVQQLFSRNHQIPQYEAPFETIAPLNLPLFIGYQTLSQCSYLLKEKIVQALEDLASNQADARKSAACWELSVCYLTGFGVEQNFEKACHWLAEAARQGVVGAQAFFLRIHRAMGMDPYETLRAKHQEPSTSISETSPSSDRALISKWLLDAASSGYSDTLPDLKLHDQEEYTTARDIHLRGLAAKVPIDENDLSLIIEFSDHPAENSAISPIAEQIIAAATSGELPLLRRLTSEVPESINFQDPTGNTPLVHAARCGKYEVLDYLLDQPDINAGICNWGQQTVLHFLDSFTDEEIQSLVPRFISRNASIDQEASFPVTASWGDAPELKPRIRSCPILQAILNNNLVLLRSLLIAVHLPALEPTRCRICEAGSRYRKMVAVAITLHRAEMIEAVQEHLRIYSAGQGSNLETIEVWYNQELLPVWKLAIRGLPAGVTDLPESFCRGLIYGERSIATLHKTLEVLWRSESAFLPKAYHQLQEAVATGNIHAIDFLMDEAKRRGYSADTWWWINDDYYQNPLLLSIRLGFRDVFKKLWSLNIAFFGISIVQPCSVFMCRACRYPFDYSGLGDICAFLFGVKRKKHKVNLAQLALSLAATATHQDDFFVSFILDNATPAHILKDPTEFDEQISHQPTSYLAQAILANSFWAADLILQKYPETIYQRVCVMPLYLRDPILDDTTQSPSRSYLLDVDTEPPPLSLSLTEYILLVGSYKSCAYLLRVLQKDRDRPSTTVHRFGIHCQQRTATVTSEEGWSGWGGLRLTPQEYQSLLTGLIKDDREDRLALWEVVSSQVQQGHTTDWYNLRLALFYGNSTAVKELLGRGWSANGPAWAHFITPLRLAMNLHRHGPGSVLPNFKDPYWRCSGPNKTPQTPGLLSFQESYEEKYNKQNAKRESNLLANVIELKRNGGYVSRIYQHQIPPWMFCLIFYSAVFPLTLAFALKISPLNLRQRIGFMYLNSVIAAALPPLFLPFSTSTVWRKPMDSTCKIASYVVFPLLWVGNHVGLPFLSLLKFRTKTSPWTFLGIIAMGELYLISFSFMVLMIRVTGSNLLK
ncbi:MAG: hypothetical protein M1840_001747 [Geoglossum simile]|nr:MAG: hypothetical protein M1840_001747 [Geoglossum simile]